MWVSLSNSEKLLLSELARQAIINSWAETHFRCGMLEVSYSGRGSGTRNTKINEPQQLSAQVRLLSQVGFYKTQSHMLSVSRDSHPGSLFHVVSFLLL